MKKLILKEQRNLLFILNTYLEANLKNINKRKSFIYYLQTMYFKEYINL
jgi:hypothetical protein